MDDFLRDIEESLTDWHAQLKPLESGVIRTAGNCSRPHSGRSWNWAGVGVAEKV